MPILRNSNMGNDDISREAIMRRIIITIFGVVLLSPAAHAEHAWGNYHWARTSTTNSIDLKGAIPSSRTTTAIHRLRSRKFQRGGQTSPRRLSRSICSHIREDRLDSDPHFGSRTWPGNVRPVNPNNQTGRTTRYAREYRASIVRADAGTARQSARR